MTTTKIDWHGVFPAVTTQFHPDLTIDYDATKASVNRLIEEGVHGIIACGSVGENSVLSPEEKRKTVAAVREAARGRVPVLSGVAEITTDAAIAYAKDLSRQGVDGLMLMPPMIYNATRRELVAWFKAISAATDLPIMLYNNPPAYRNDVTPEIQGHRQVRHHRCDQGILGRHAPLHRSARRRGRPVRAVLRPGRCGAGMPGTRR